MTAHPIRALALAAVLTLPLAEPGVAGAVQVGRGTPASCTSAAVVSAVARGGVVTFDCGPAPVTILMRRTAKVRNTNPSLVIDGGGLVTLSGGGRRRILYQNTCDRAQVWTTATTRRRRGWSSRTSASPRATPPARPWTVEEEARSSPGAGG